MTLPITVVDAFTDSPFSGNPAGVVILTRPAPATWMQSVAAEVNLAETAFVRARGDGEHDLRWFTPTIEVDLCGHATLATAHVLGGSRRFHTRSGRLTCASNPDGSITLDLPATTVDTPATTDGWAAALGLDPDRVVAVSVGSGWDLVEVATGGDITDCVVDRAALLELGGHAVVVADTTADETTEFDSVCRTFAPAAGIDEDPVTGAAHCIIGPWLAARTGRTTFRARQASARGGVLGIEVHGDRVHLTGTAVSVWAGSLLTEPPPV